MREFKERRYISKPIGMTEAIICRLVVAFPWLLESAQDIHPDEIDAMSEMLRGELLALKDREEKHARRITNLFHNHAVNFCPKTKIDGCE